MTYYIDTGAARFEQADDYDAAREIALAAMASALDFKRRAGWIPYWAQAVEIRRGAQLLDWDGEGETVVRTTRPLMKWEKERARIVREAAQC